MASLGDLYFNIGAKTGNLKKGISAAQKSLNNLDSTGKKLGKSLDAIFDKAAYEISKDTGKSFDSIRKNLIELSKYHKEQANSMSSAIEKAFNSMGKKSDKETARMLKNAQKLADAYDISRIKLKNLGLTDEQIKTFKGTTLPTKTRLRNMGIPTKTRLHNMGIPMLGQSAAWGKNNGPIRIHNLGIPTYEKAMQDYKMKSAHESYHTAMQSILNKSGDEGKTNLFEKIFSNTRVSKNITSYSNKLIELSKSAGETGGILGSVASTLGKVGGAASKAAPYIAVFTTILSAVGKVAKPLIKVYLNIFKGVVKTTGSIALNIGKTLLNGLIAPLKTGLDLFSRSHGYKYGRLLGAGITAGLTYKLSGFFKSLLSGGGEFEQMTQGIQILFADTRTSIENDYSAINAASDKMRENALMAYKNVGMSATDYMSQASGFATRIISEVGGDTNKAADIINTAMQDMSDNWHLLGGDFEMIQNAYQGLLRGNYRMFDNLKLGYGQTKAEVERLLKDAEKLSGVHYNIDNLSDIMLAIHEIQEATGMTGTTAREAMTTWAGAVNMLKNSWQNFKDTVGQGLIYLLRPVLAVIAKISDALTLVGLKFMRWAQKITGIKDMVVGKKNDKDYASAATGIGGVNDALGGIGGTANKAKKAVKDLKRELMGFDKINKLSGEKGTDNDTGTTGSSGTGGGVDLEDLTDQSWMNRMVKSAGEDLVTFYEKAIKEAWEKADFTMVGWNAAQKIAEGLEKINWDKVKDFCGRLGASIATFLSGVFMNGRLWIDVGNAFAEALNSIINFGYQFVTNFYWTGFGEAIGTAINQAIFKIDANKLGQLISERIKGGLDFAIALIDKIDFKQIGTKIYNVLFNIDFPAIKEKAGKLGKSIANAINDVFNNDRLWNEAGTSLGEAINSIVNYGFNLVHNVEWKQIGLDLAASISNAFKELDGKKLGQTIFDTLNGVFDTLLTFMDNTDWDTVYAKVEDVVTAIDWGTLFEKAFTLTDETTEKLWNIGKIIFKEIWNGLWDGWESSWRKKSIDPKINGSLKVKVEPDEESEKLTWEDIKSWWNNAGKNLDKDPKQVKLKENKTSLSDVWTKIKSWWDNSGKNLDKDPKQVKLKENRTSLSEVWDRIKSWWNGKKLNEKEPKVKVKIPTWSELKDKWKNLMAKFKGKTAEIKLSIKTIAKEAWNSVARKFNDLKSAHPIIMKAFPKLPYLAQGGFVKANTPQLAVIGDNKREGEIVAPESKLAAMAAQAAGAGNDETNMLLRQLIALVAGLNLNVQLDGEQIKNNTVRRINNHTRATGQLEIII